MRGTSAPKPMSAREQEMEAVRAAERSSGMISSNARKTSHVGTAVGCPWSQEVVDAVSALTNPDLDDGNLVVIVCDSTIETEYYTC